MNHTYVFTLFHPPSLSLPSQSSSACTGQLVRRDTSRGVDARVRRSKRNKKKKKEEKKKTTILINQEWNPNGIYFFVREIRDIRIFSKSVLFCPFYFLRRILTGTLNSHSFRFIRRTDDSIDAWLCKLKARNVLFLATANDRRQLSATTLRRMPRIN